MRCGVCNQNTVRRREMEQKFGQTERIVLDILEQDPMYIVIELGFNAAFNSISIISRLSV